MTRHSHSHGRASLTAEIPYGYCHCGCGGKAPLMPRDHSTKGHIKGKPYRFIHGHNSRGTGNVENYVVNTQSGCWEWQGATNTQGYGQLRHMKRLYLAHRFLYEREVGPIPEGLTLDHLCRNPICVNPAHLEPVTRAENVRRGNAWKINGLKTHCPKGHLYEGDNLYVNPNKPARVCITCRRAHQRAYRERQRQTRAIA